MSGGLNKGHLGGGHCERAAGSSEMPWAGARAPGVGAKTQPLSQIRPRAARPSRACARGAEPRTSLFGYSVGPSPQVKN